MSKRQNYTTNWETKAEKIISVPVTIYHLKTVQTVAVYNNIESYKIKLYSNMLQWGAPPSSGQVHFIG